VNVVNVPSAWRVSIRFAICIFSFLFQSGRQRYQPPVRFTPKRARRLALRRLALLGLAALLLDMVREELPGPQFDLLSGFRFRHAVAFLNLASQRLDIAFDLFNIVVREFTPLVAHTSAQLLPVTLNSFV
jgi:hypothetical protein